MHAEESNGNRGVNTDLRDFFFFFLSHYLDLTIDRRIVLCYLLFVDTHSFV